MQMRVLENPFSKYKKFALFCAAVGHELLQKTTARYQYYHWKLLWISQITHCVSKGRLRYLLSLVLELDLISLLQWVLSKWIASWFLMRIMESLINTTMKKLPQMVAPKWVLILDEPWGEASLREGNCDSQKITLRGCGLREVLKIFGEIKKNYLWRSRWRSAWVWAEWLNVWRKVEKEEKKRKKKRNGMFWNESGWILEAWSSGVFWWRRKV